MKNIREFSLETRNGKLAYLPGEVLRGELYITLEDEMEVKAIKLFLQGEGAGEWLEQDSHNLTDKRKDTDGRLMKRTFVDIGLRVFGKSSKEDKIPQVHPAGRYVYEFQFSIPQNLPSTFKSPIEKDLGYVRYCLKAILTRPRKYDKIAKLTFVINDLISPDRPELSFLPGSSESKPVKSGCVSAGTLFLESCLSRAYYAQGEYLMINATAENESTKVMKEMYAKLIRRVRCKGRFGTKTYTTDAATRHGSRVAAEGRLVWKNQKLRIPPIGPTVVGNVDIRVDYFVRVGMYEEYGSEIHIDLPVIIGTIGTEEEMKKRQKEEEDEEWARKKERQKVYQLKLVKAGEQREEYRDILQNKLGHPEPINIADDVWLDGLLNRGRKITFDTNQRRGSDRRGKAASHSPSKRRHVESHRSGRRSASADSQGVKGSGKHSLEGGRLVLGGKLGSSRDKLSAANKSESRGSLASKEELSGSRGSLASKEAKLGSRGSLGSKRDLSGSGGELSTSKGALSGSRGSLAGSRESILSEGRSGSRLSRSASGERSVGRGRSTSKEGLRRSGSNERRGRSYSAEAAPMKPGSSGNKGLSSSLRGKSIEKGGSKEGLSRLGRGKSYSKENLQPSLESGTAKSHSREMLSKTGLKEKQQPRSLSEGRYGSREKFGSKESLGSTRRSKSHESLLNSDEPSIADSLMKTEEGRKAIEDGIPISREGRKRLAGIMSNEGKEGEGDDRGTKDDSKSSQAKKVGKSSILSKGESAPGESEKSRDKSSTKRIGKQEEKRSTSPNKKSATTFEKSGASKISSSSRSTSPVKGVGKTGHGKDKEGTAESSNQHDSSTREGTTKKPSAGQSGKETDSHKGSKQGEGKADGEVIGEGQRTRGHGKSSSTGDEIPSDGVGRAYDKGRKENGEEAKEAQRETKKLPADEEKMTKEETQQQDGLTPDLPEQQNGVQLSTQEGYVKAGKMKQIDRDPSEETKQKEGNAVKEMNQQNGNVIGEKTQKSATQTRTSAAAKKKDKDLQKENNKGSLLNPLDTSADKIKYLEEFEQLEQEFKMQSARRKQDPKSTQSPVENYDDFQESLSKKPATDTKKITGDQSGTTKDSGITSKHIDPYANLMKDNEPYEPYDNNDVPMSPIREQEEIEGYLVGGRKSKENIITQAKGSTQPGSNEKQDNSGDTLVKEKTGKGTVAGKQNDSEKTTSQPKSTKAPKGTVTDTSKAPSYSKKTTITQNRSEDTSGKSSNDRSAAEAAKSGSKSKSKRSGTPDPKHSNANQKNMKKSPDNVGSTISSELAMTGDQMIEGIELKQQQQQQEQQQLQEKEIQPIQINQEKYEIPGVEEIFGGEKEKENAEQQQEQQQQQEKDEKSPYQDNKDVKPSKIPKKNNQVTKKPGTKTTGKPTGEMEDNAAKSENKKTAWKFIGGAVGKFLGKLKPKQDKKESEDVPQSKGKSDSSETADKKSGNAQKKTARGKESIAGKAGKEGTKDRDEKECPEEQAIDETKQEEQLKELESELQLDITQDSEGDIKTLEKPDEITSEDMHLGKAQQDKSVGKSSARKSKKDKPGTPKEKQGTTKDSDQKEYLSTKEKDGKKEDKQTPSGATKKQGTKIGSTKTGKEEGKEQTLTGKAGNNNQHGIPYRAKRNDDTEEFVENEESLQQQTTQQTPNIVPSEGLSTGTSGIPKKNNRPGQDKTPGGTPTRNKKSTSGIPKKEKSLVGTPKRDVNKNATTSNNSGTPKKDTGPGWNSSVSTPTRNSRYGEIETPKKDQARPRRSTPSSTPTRKVRDVAGTPNKTNTGTPSRTPSGTPVKIATRGSSAPRATDRIGSANSTPTRSRSAPGQHTPEKNRVKPRGVTSESVPKSPTASRGRGRSPTKKRTGPYADNSRAVPRGSRKTEVSSDGDSERKYSSDSLEGSERRQSKQSSAVSTPSKTPTKGIPSYQGHRASPKHSPLVKTRATSAGSSRAASAGSSRASGSPGKKPRPGSSDSTGSRNLACKPRSTSAGNTPTRQPDVQKKNREQRATSSPGGARASHAFPRTITIPQVDETGRRSSSLSSIDSLMSNTEVDREGERYKLHNPPEKLFGSKRYPVTNAKPKRNLSHSYPSYPKKRSREDPREIFNKEAVLSSGRSSAQSSPNHQAKAHPELGTAVQRQKYLDELLLKTGKKSIDRSPSKGKSRPKYAVRDESPGFIDEYLHSPISSRNSSRHNSPVKTAKSPARYIVTQSPDSAVKPPPSPVKKRSKLYKHIESPTKKLMNTKPNYGDYIAVPAGHKYVLRKPTKPDQIATNNTTNKTSNTPTKRTVSRETSPVKSKSMSTPSKKSKPKTQVENSSSKIPKPGTRSKKTTKQRESNIQIYSYNPDAETSDEKVSGSDKESATLSFTEQQMKHGSPATQRKIAPNKDTKPVYQSPYRQIPRNKESRERSPAQHQLAAEKYLPEQARTPSHHRGRPSSRNDNSHVRAKSENDLPLTSKQLHEKTQSPRNAVSLDTKFKKELECKHGHNNQTPDRNYLTDKPQISNGNRKIPTDGRKTPTDGRKTPIDGRNIPNDGRKTPNDGCKTSNDGRNIPNDGRKTPNDGRKTPIEDRKTTNDGRKTPIEGRKTTNDGRKTPIDGRKTPNDGRKTPTDGRKTPSEGRKSPAKGILKQNIEQNKSSPYDQYRKLPKTPSYKPLDRLNRSDDGSYSVGFATDKDKTTSGKYSKSPDRARNNISRRRSSGEHCDTPRPTPSPNRLSNSFDHLSYTPPARSPYNMLRFTGNSSYDMYSRPYGYRDRFDDGWRNSSFGNYRYYSGGMTLPRVPYERTPYDVYCQPGSEIHQARNTSDRTNAPTHERQEHDDGNADARQGEDDDYEETVSQFMNSQNGMEEQEGAMKSASQCNKNPTKKQQTPKWNSSTKASQEAYEDWLKNEYLPPKSEVVPPTTEFAAPKSLVQPNINPFYNQMEKEKYVPRSSVVPLLHEGGKQSPPHTSAQKEQSKGGKTRGSKLPVRKDRTLQHVSFDETKKPKKKAGTKLSTQNQDKQHPRYNERTPFPEKCSHDNSLEMPDPYTQQCFQNTSNKLIYSGIVPVNYFPIVCSSHLPKKIGNPRHTRDMKHDPNVMPRPKSNSPERSMKLVDDSKKRSRSHSPQKRSYGLDEQDNKRPRLGSLNKEMTENETNTHESEKTSEEQQMTSHEQIRETKEVKDKDEVAKDRSKNKLKIKTKSKIPKNPGTQQPKKKKEKILSASWPPKKHVKMGVKSPRVVLRDDHQPGRRTYLRAIARQNQNYITPYDTPSNAHRSNENLSEVHRERLDSSGNISYDERILIGGGLSFNSPTKTSHKNKKSSSAKKKASKDAGEDSTDFNQEVFLCEEQDPIGRKIDQEVLKQNLEGGMDTYTIPSTTCGFTAKSNGVAYEIPFGGNNSSSSYQTNNKKMKSMKAKPYDTDNKKKGGVVKGTPKTPLGNEINNGVLDSPFLARYEKLTKKELEERMQQNVVVATPIDRSKEPTNVTTALPSKVPEWFEEKHQQQQNQQEQLRQLPALPKPQRNGLAAGRSKDESYDSFEQHEKCFGIIDEHGQVLSNVELLKGGDKEEAQKSSTSKERRHQRKKERKNQRLLHDLEEIRHQRRSSCPGTLGPRDGILSVSDDPTSFSNSVDSIEDNRMSKTKIIESKIERTREYKKNKQEINVEASSRETRSTTSSGQVPLGGFGYEEEVIETIEFTEDRPINVETRGNREERHENPMCLAFDIPMVTSESLSSVLKSSDEVSVTSRSGTTTADEYSSQCSDRDGFHKELFFSTAFPSAVCEERATTTSMIQTKRSGIPRWRNLSYNS